MEAALVGSAGVFSSGLLTTMSGGALVIALANVVAPTLIVLFADLATILPSMMRH